MAPTASNAAACVHPVLKHPVGIVRRRVFDLVFERGHGKVSQCSTFEPPARIKDGEVLQLPHYYQKQKKLVPARGVRL